MRANDALVVATELGLRSGRSANWRDGVAAAYAGRETHAIVFVTPPVQGWVLAVGAWEAPLDDVELLERLSARFGEAQFFMTLRTNSHGGWARAIAGRTEQRVEFGDGALMVAEGPPSAIELELGFRAEERPAALAGGDEPSFLDEERDVLPEEGEVLGITLDESEVLQVAAAWSIDPSTLDERDEPRAPGVLGRMR